MSNPIDDDYDEYDRGYDGEEDRPRRRRFRRGQLPASGLGIAASILGVFSGCLILVAFIMAVAMAADHPKGNPRENPQVMALGFMVCGGGLASVVGCILGFIGMILPDRRKGYAILGFCLNAAILAGVAIIMVIGMIGKEAGR
jgi:hypothetical protein